MKIVVDKNLKTLLVYAQGDEVPKVTGSKNPVPDFLVYKFKNFKLIKDNVAISRLPSPIRDAVIKTYEFPLRITEYDGVSVAWSEAKYPGVWSPSIDTVVFAYSLRKSLVQPKRLINFSSMLEIGCGSGFLTKYLLVKKKELESPMEEAHLMDINADAIKCALDNFESAKDKTNILYSHNSPNHPLQINRPYDLVICNPPYLPRPGAKSDNPYEGLFLYYEIFNKASKMLSKKSVLFTSFSSLSEAITIPLFKKKFNVEIIFEMKIPLKIPQVFSGLSKESRKWVSYLERQGNLEVDAKERSGYRYWEKIKIARCNLVK